MSVYAVMNQEQLPVLRRAQREAHVFFHDNALRLHPSQRVLIANLLQRLYFLTLKVEGFPFAHERICCQDALAKAFLAILTVEVDSCQKQATQAENWYKELVATYPRYA